MQVPFSLWDLPSFQEFQAESLKHEFFVCAVVCLFLSLKHDVFDFFIMENAKTGFTLTLQGIVSFQQNLAWNENGNLYR